MTPAALTLPEAAQDAFSRLTWRFHDPSWVRLRDLFIGALHLGEVSTSLSGGWWRRERLPLPTTFEGAWWCRDHYHPPNNHPPNTPCDEGCLAKRVADQGWQILHVAYLPDRRIVRWRAIEVRGRRRTRHVDLSPVKQLIQDGFDMFVRDLPRIRAELETFTGTTVYTSPEHILDGLRGMPDHWARAMIMLHGVATRSRWWGRAA